MTKIDTIANSTLALTTVIGVGGAIATYFSEFLKMPFKWIAVILVIYISVILLFIIWLRRKLRWVII